MSPYGNFNLARQEFKKAALKALSELRKEMGNHLRVNIKLTIKLFDALISPMRVKYRGLIAMDNWKRIQQNSGSK